MCRHNFPTSQYFLRQRLCSKILFFWSFQSFNDQETLKEQLKWIHLCWYEKRKVFIGFDAGIWATLFYTGVSFQVLWLHNLLKSSPLHRSTEQLVWVACADMLCLVFCIYDGVHYGQTSLLWSHMSKGHCSTSLVVCSDVQNFANLSYAVTHHPTMLSRCRLTCCS